MAKCAMCVFHEKNRRLENAFLANYNEAKTMHFPCTIGHDICVKMSTQATNNLT